MLAQEKAQAFKLSSIKCCFNESFKSQKWIITYYKCKVGLETRVSWWSAYFAGTKSHVCFPEYHKLDMVAHTCSPWGWQAEIGEPECKKKISYTVSSRLFWDKIALFQRKKNSNKRKKWQCVLSDITMVPGTQSLLS